MGKKTSKPIPATPRLLPREARLNVGPDGTLRLAEGGMPPRGELRVLIAPEPDDAAWMALVANSLGDYLHDPAEDVYSAQDGTPYRAD